MFTFFQSTCFLLKKILHPFKCLATCPLSDLLTFKPKHLGYTNSMMCVCFPSILDKLHPLIHRYLATQHCLSKNLSIFVRCYVAWLQLHWFSSIVTWVCMRVGRKIEKKLYGKNICGFITIPYILVLRLVIYKTSNSWLFQWMDKINNLTMDTCFMSRIILEVFAVPHRGKHKKYH